MVEGEDVPDDVTGVVENERKSEKRCVVTLSVYVLYSTVRD